MTRRNKLAPFDNILKDLRQQVKEHKVNFSTTQIVALLLSIVVCAVLLSTQFGLNLSEIILVCILMLGAAGLIFYLWRRLF